MCHNNSALTALPLRPNETTFQKIPGLNDFYFGDEAHPFPLGHMQMLGKSNATMLRAEATWGTPEALLGGLAHRAVDFWLTSEDVPDKDNRVEVSDEGITLHYIPNNLEGSRSSRTPCAWRITSSSVSNSTDRSIPMKHVSIESLPEAVSPTCLPPKMLSGQKALVTGASSGIGRAIALALGRAGADVVVSYGSSEKAAHEVVDEITAMGVNAFTHRADVSSEPEVLAMFERVKSKWGTLDILINNAGLQQDAPFHEMTLEQWNRVIGVNLTGQFLCAREAIREFLRRGVVESVSVAAGKIICVSSVHEFIPWAGHVNYAASKGGVMLMMKSIAQEVAGHRIRVNSIAPGAIRTPINRAAWETPEAYRDLMRLIPYNRIGEVEDMGRVAAWLASDQADYIVGTTVVVDGGMSLYPGFEAGG